MENPGKQLKALSEDGRQLDHSVRGVASCLRRLRKALERNLPVEKVKEEKELLPGGDLRLTGNTWVRKSWEESEIERAPREAEVRKVIYQLANIYDGLCVMANMFFVPPPAVLRPLR